MQEISELKERKSLIKKKDKLILNYIEQNMRFYFGEFMSDCDILWIRF